MRADSFLYEGKIQGIDTPDIILEKFKDILCPPRLKRNNTDNDYTPVIRVHELVKQFGTFTAVDHISFEVKRGEIFGFWEQTVLEKQQLCAFYAD